MQGDHELEHGILVILSGPSGVGKGTVCSALRRRGTDILYSVSATTRAPRQGEVNGVNYFFKTENEFKQMIDNDQLLEWAQYADRYYGTPKAYVEEQIQKGYDVLLEIEVQGAMQVKEKYPQGIFIFLAPPSMMELQQRIQSRGTESLESIRDRMHIATEEVEMMKQYDYVVVNDEVERACDRIESIIVAEHCKKERKIKQFQRILHRQTNEE